MAFDGTLKFNTAIDEKGFQTGLGKLGGMAKTAASGLVSGVGTAAKALTTAFAGAAAAGTAAVGAIGKQALDAYADFEQLAGGVETLFGDAADVVKANAAAAFQSAGMSVNDYMETATASAAAMVNSLGGDVQKAADLTDMAVRDMADNSNKMGTALDSIQNAYAGFAKGNFTMLDNLKLGYGGTKEEMQRLLETATALTGVQYDITSYADIVQAIHAVQEQMGITGTTAREASETISGSVAAMKAAWDNLLVGVADDSQDFDKLCEDFVTSFETAAGNILPRAESVGEGVVKLIGALGDDAVNFLLRTLQSAPELVGTGVQLIGTFVDGLATGLPTLLPLGKRLLLTLANGVINGAPVLLDAANALTDGFANAVEDPQIAGRLERMGSVLLSALSEGLRRNLPILTEAGLSVVSGLLDFLLDPALFSDMLSLGILLLSMLGQGIIDNLPMLLDAALQIIEILMQSLGDNAGELVGAAILILSILGQFLAEHAPELTTAALELLLAIVEGLTDNSDELLLAVEEIIKALWDALSDPENQKMLIDAGFALLVAILNGARKFGGELLGFAYDLFEASWDTLTSMDWGELGKNLLLGIIRGMRNSDLGALNGVKDRLLDGVQDKFGIESPSKLMRDEVGKYLALGIGEGFTDNMPDVGNAAKDAFDSVLEPIGMYGDLTISVDTSALDALEAMRLGVDPAAVDAYRAAMPGVLQSDISPAPSSTYITNQTYSSITNQTTTESPDRPAPTGDIIIPVSIGGEAVETVVVSAAQRANATSGGTTI